MIKYQDAKRFLEVPTELVERVRDSRRPPDWRWQRAVAAEAAGVGSPKRGKKGEEAIVVAAFDYLRYKKKDERDNPTGIGQAAANKYPLFHEVDRIHDDTKSNEDRWTIESLVLANESREAITAECSLGDERIVELYELLFFDVRDRLDKRQFIRSHVLKGVTEATISKQNPAMLWKVLGYYGDGDVLRSYWEQGKLNEELEAWFATASRGHRFKNLYLAQAGYDVNRFTARYVVENSAKDRLVDIAAKQAGATGDDEAAKRTTQLTESLGLTFASVGRATQIPVGRVEPRAMDMVRDAFAAVNIDLNGPPGLPTSRPAPQPAGEPGDPTTPPSEQEQQT